MTILYWIIGIALSIACAVTCTWLCHKYEGMPDAPIWVSWVAFGTFIPGIPAIIFFAALSVVVAAAAFALEVIVGRWPRKESKK